MPQAIRGEIRRVKAWNQAGHEATGNRPSLVVSPDWFNSGDRRVIIPLTSPGPNHENWWEPQLSATDSVCLVPDIRTVPAATLYGPVKGTATPDELQDVRSAFSRLTGGQEDDPYGACTRGEVWKVNLGEPTERVDPVEVEVLILHFNPLNCMAMAALVTSTKRRESPTVTEIKSSPLLRNHWVLLANLRPLATNVRLMQRVDELSGFEMDRITKKLTNFIYS